MGFKSVYRLLQEIFPEVDSRLLRAVAIEHSKDADAAVNDVLNEVIPKMAHHSAQRKSIPIEDKKLSNGIHFVDERNDNLMLHRPVFTVGESSKGGSSSNGNSRVVIIDLDEIDDTRPSQSDCTDVGKYPSTESTDRVSITEVHNCGSSSGPGHTDAGNCVAVLEPTLILDIPDKDEARIGEMDKVPEIALTNGCNNAGAATTSCDEHANEAQPLSFPNEGDCHFSVENVDEELIVLKGIYEHNHMESTRNVDSLSNALENKETDDQVIIISDESEVVVPGDKVDGIMPCVSPTTVDTKIYINGILTEPVPNSLNLDLYLAYESVDSGEQSVNVDQNMDDILLAPSNIVAEIVPPSEFVGTVDTCVLQSEQCLHIPSGGNALSGSNVNDYSFIEMCSNDDDFASNKQSGQICSTDFLDEIIEDAKNNKKNLFSVMESVMNMIKEVELQERATELAKEEAAMGGHKILLKVEEMKQMLAHAKEANDMHAGEVYGEKSILATEARELQSRLLCLSDERDKSLATLEEMRQTLEARLAAAEEAKNAAEQEKLGKEESARDALAEQEAIMEKVVQESKLLEHEAAENFKLQEFLVDRGRVVDILQGEISVICQDVRLLKEKFDKRVPLSMSVSSSQTTCKLASSGSSLKSTSSLTPPEEPESLFFKNIPVNETSSVSSVTETLPKPTSVEEESVKHVDRVMEDDEWEIFDKDEELNR